VCHDVISGTRHHNHTITVARCITLLFTLPCAKAHIHPIAAACCPLLPPFTNATNGANAPASSVRCSPQHQTTPGANDQTHHMSQQTALKQQTASKKKQTPPSSPSSRNVIFMPESCAKCHKAPAECSFSASLPSLSRETSGGRA
jgi:hypothetical protein